MVATEPQAISPATGQPLTSTAGDVGSYTAHPNPLKFNDEAKRIFLEAISEGYSTTHAAKQAGVSYGCAYEHRATNSDFALAWKDAYESGGDWGEDQLREKVKSVKGVIANIVFLKMRKRYVEGPAALQVNIFPSDRPLQEFSIEQLRAMLPQVEAIEGETRELTEGEDQVGDST